MRGDIGSRPYPVNFSSGGVALALASAFPRIQDLLFLLFLPFLLFLLFLPLSALPQISYLAFKPKKTAPKEAA
ncbi:hypothetical protein BCT30_21350 [Enterovibrio norvegicus]|nr:hypothetical protein BCU47_02880 [Enterovibrio norvegicus]PMI34634.1 hypothetical protein BCU46_20605 [Enterovibrio norvegicus]PMN47166.1 hypothetical protein BCT30_21350 [Enterovibrio norvegicus]